ncbi:MAG: hypothetical protein ACE5EC_04640 [Phycisphaerae bacterium]
MLLVSRRLRRISQFLNQRARSDHNKEPRTLALYVAKQCQESVRAVLITPKRQKIAPGLLVITLFLLLPLAQTAQAEPGPAIGWIENFADDPIAAGRFTVPPGHDATRFSFNATLSQLTAHYDTSLPTAWLVRPIDPNGGRVLDRYDDFEFSVTFRIRSAGFFADPNQFAQIGWALINTTTTGEDRAGGSAGPYAYDLVGFDYFPNVSPLFGGPTLGPTVIHTDDGAGFFSNIDFAFGAETTIDPAAGEEAIALDTTYTARIVYAGAVETATLTIHNGTRFLDINAEGGGSDTDPTTIQLQALIDNRVSVNAFALTAWEDTFNPFSSSVIADVDIEQIEFSATESKMGDINLDSLVNGEDIAPFLQLMLSPDPDPDLLARADFSGNGMLDPTDIGPFVATLIGP